MVSIIVPAYNVAEYIRECLDSALAQTYGDIELIVVDDGSTDSTPEIIREYAAIDPRVRLLTQQNKGLSGARNAGLLMARGEWISFLDSDDIMLPDAIDSLLKAAATSGADYVEAAWIEGVDYNGRPIRKHSRCQPRCFAPEEYIEKVLYQDNVYPSACGKLFARRLFDGLAFREGILYEDLDLFYHLAGRAGKIAAIRDEVYFYRKNPTSLTGAFSPRRFDVLEVTRRIEDYMAAHHPRLSAAARDRRLSANFNMFGLIAAYDRDSRHAPIAAGCWSLIKSYRRESLFNPQVRLKNKVGILASYLGPAFLRFLSRHFYGGRVR